MNIIEKRSISEYNIYSMKYLQKFKLFESNYSLEEYIDTLSDELGKWNISPVHIKKIIDNNIDDIQISIENGSSPIEFSKKLINDLQLDRGGYTSQIVNHPLSSQIKYL